MTLFLGPPFAFGTILLVAACTGSRKTQTEEEMNGIIYLVGLVVIILAVLSLVGLR